MAAKDDSESVREEGDQRIVDLGTAGCLQRDWQRKMEFRRGGQNWNGKRYHGGKGGKDGGKK